MPDLSPTIDGVGIRLGTTWANTVGDGTTAAGMNTTTTFDNTGINAIDLSAFNATQVERYYVEFDTSGVTSSPESATFKIYGKSIYNPAVSFDGTIYVGSDKGLYAIEPDGSIIWKYNGMVLEAPFIDRNGIIYFGTKEKKLIALYRDGSKKWEHNANGNVASPGAIGSNDVIYFGTDENSINAVNRDSTKNWAFKTEGIVELSPAVDKNGMIYCVDTLGNLYVLNGKGALEWKVKVSSQSAPTLGTNNLMVVGNEVIDTKIKSIIYK